MGKKHSPIWVVNRDLFIQAFHESETLVEMYKNIGFHGYLRGGLYKTIKQRILEEGLDVNEILNRSKKAMAKHLACHRKRKDTDEYLVLGSKIRTTDLKRRLINEGYVANACSKCGLGPEWDSLPLTFHLHHKNGNSRDNRLENLCLLCPNCHSQTDTYCSKKAP